MSVVTNEYVMGDDFSVEDRRHTNSEIFISRAYRFVFHAIPKVASQSVIKELTSLHFFSNADGERLAVPVDEFYRDNPDYRRFFKYAFVRHPFSRAVSCFLDKVVRTDERKQRMLARDGLAMRPDTFEEFVNFLCSPAACDRLANPHWCSQHTLICDAQGRLFVNAVGRLETLREDQEAILGRFEIPQFKPHWKNNRRDDAAAAPDAAFWTAEIEAKLRRRYARDYELFGYGPFMS